MKITLAAIATSFVVVFAASPDAMARQGRGGDNSAAERQDRHRDDLAPSPRTVEDRSDDSDTAVSNGNTSRQTRGQGRGRGRGVATGRGRGRGGNDG